MPLSILYTSVGALGFISVSSFRPLLHSNPRVRGSRYLPEPLFAAGSGDLIIPLDSLAQSMSEYDQLYEAVISVSSRPLFFILLQVLRLQLQMKMSKQ